MIVTFADSSLLHVQEHLTCLLCLPPFFSSYSTIPQQNIYPFVILPPICLEFHTAVKFFKYRFDYKLIFQDLFSYLVSAPFSCILLMFTCVFVFWLQDMVAVGDTWLCHFTVFSFKKVARRWLEYDKKVVGRWLGDG